MNPDGTYQSTRPDEVWPARYWHRLEDGRIQCDLCPRFCRLRDGQRGLCFIRARRGDELVLTSYGRSSGFCIDPIEKKPLFHFLPGTPVLSFGTAGCNLTCKFCQNWDISKAGSFDRLQAAASPEHIARAALVNGARSVAFTYNDPVIFLEYAVDTAIACHEVGVKTVAVSAGYITAKARRELFSHIDAANIDLKGFTEGFYKRLCSGSLAPVLDTLRYLRHETNVWLEITTLLVPGENDSPGEVRALAEWIMDHLGPDVPLHFSAFFPEWKMLQLPATSPTTLRQARSIAKEIGLHHVYVGNVRDQAGESTYCPHCDTLLIGRNGYRITAWQLDEAGCCERCKTPLAGRFEARPGEWGARRQTVRPGAAN